MSCLSISSPNPGEPLRQTMWGMNCMEAYNANRQQKGESFFCVILDISEAESPSATTAHKGLNAALHPFEGARMPIHPGGGAHSSHGGRHGALRLWTVASDADRWSLVDNIAAKY